MTMPTRVGTVLAGATTEAALIDLLEAQERSIRVGEYLIIRDSLTGNSLLARVSQIVPEHEFYRRGDSFSATRRAGLGFPSGVGMQYVSCKVEIMGELSGNRLRRVRRSPGPGSEAFLADDATLRSIFSSASSSNEPSVTFANLLYYPNVPIALRLNHITEHIGVFGKTGSGKSFLVGALIEALENIIHNNRRYLYPIIIIDHHGDYTNIPLHHDFPGKLYSLSPRTGVEGYNRLRIDLEQLSSADLAELVIKFYSGEITESSAKQVEGLQLAIDSLHASPRNINHNAQFTTHFNNLRDEINALTGPPPAPIHTATGGAILRAIGMFHRRISRFIGSYNYGQWFDTITCNGGLHIIDLSVTGSPGVDIVIKQLVVGYLAHLIFNWFSTHQERYLMFILEEAQNFCPRITEYRVGQPALSTTGLVVLATQGRKFGASLCLVSQRPGFMEKAVISQCNTFFIKRISPEDKAYVLSATGGLPEDYAERITNLDREEVVIAGTMLTPDFPIIAQLRPQHRRTPHGIGEPNPLASFENTQPQRPPLS